jgi:hypothetical protein
MEGAGMTNTTYQASRRRVIFREMMAAHGIDRCVIVTGSFRAGTSFVCSLLGANGMAGIRDERFGKLDTIFRNPDEDFQNQLEQIFRACGHSGFPTGLNSDSSFQNGGLSERRAVCADR